MKLGRSMMVNSGSKLLQFFRGGADQQLMHEQRVPGIFGDHPHADTMGEIGAAEQILGEQFAALGMGHHVGIAGRRNAPGSCGLLLSHHTWSFGVRRRAPRTCRRPSGRCAGRCSTTSGTVLGDMAFAAPHRFFIERRRAEIQIHAFQIAKAVTAQGRKRGVGSSMRDAARRRRPHLPHNRVARKPVRASNVVQFASRPNA